jgi:alpha-amylase/alpha-mannosidase (GH57 family)
MPDGFLCIHGHFYQPPRSDPSTGQIPQEASAAPYANWNERITAECYSPMAIAGHFEAISFNLGSTLARWLAQNADETYEKIVRGEQAYYAAHGVGNGLAQPAHHTILPMARRRDKICQVRWGLASFAHRFGHPPAGMWLPEMAVDLETLETISSEGVRFVILSDEQVEGELVAGAGPYQVRLRGSKDIAIFVRDRALSNSLSFTMPEPDTIQEWLDQHLTPRQSDGDLLLIATDGETFGHHNPQGVEVLTDILSAAAENAFELTTLELYLSQNPPQHDITIIENTAWSCSHRLGRWVSGCDCTPGDGRWKGTLRRALDNLACDLDTVFLKETQRLGIGAWELRDSYIEVVLGKTDGPSFLVAHDLGHLDSQDEHLLLMLLEAQLYRQRMYASCTFFFDDLDRLEPRYAIANGFKALSLTKQATGEDLTSSFRRDLSVAVSGVSGKSGSDVLEELGS